MAGFLTSWLPVGFVLVAAAAMAAGWYLRKRHEGQHGQAVEASSHEFVLAAGRARDRARGELEELKSRHKKLQGEHRKRAREIKTLNGKCAELQARLDRSTRKKSHAPLPPALPGKQLDPANGAAPVDLSRPAGRAKRTKRAASGVPAFVLLAPDGPKDDLTAIRGIGPGLERALNDLGVFHYCQLAGLTGDEIDWLGQRLGSFPGRIRKDGWPEQARRLFATSPAKSAKPARRRRRSKTGVRLQTARSIISDV